jgi:hypothetical protein
MIWKFCKKIAETHQAAKKPENLLRRQKKTASCMNEIENLHIID